MKFPIYPNQYLLLLATDENGNVVAYIEIRLNTNNIKAERLKKF